jgi:hypothetical protein
VCILARAAISGSDVINSYTRVLVARLTWDLWSCPVMPCSKCLRFLRPRHMVKSVRYWKLLGPSWVGEGGGLGRQVAIFCLLISTIMRKRDGADCSRVQFFLGWWSLPFSQVWWGHIQYEGVWLPSRLSLT